MTEAELATFNAEARAKQDVYQRHRAAVRAHWFADSHEWAALNYNANQEIKE